MAKRSSSSMEVLLGLLTIEPMSGYDLGQNIRTSVGYLLERELRADLSQPEEAGDAEGMVTSKTERQKASRSGTFIPSRRRAGSGWRRGSRSSRSRRFRATNCC
jgi:hypothetical protein